MESVNAAPTPPATESGRRVRSASTRSPRAMLVGVAVIVAVIFLAGFLGARRARQEARAEELLIVQGIRRVCKLATVEVTLADYARKSVPKTVDLPFTKAPLAYLFYSGVVSAGFDVCDSAAGIALDHRLRQVRITLPEPKILSIDIQRFETINEESGFLNTIGPTDRNRWYAEARAALENGALAQGALDKAAKHAAELFAGLVERHGYTVVFDVHGRPTPVGEKVAPLEIEK